MEFYWNENGEEFKEDIKVLLFDSNQSEDSFEFNSKIDNAVSNDESKFSFNNYSRDKKSDGEVNFDAIVWQAWKLHLSGLNDEALSLIDIVLKENSNNEGYYNVKALIFDSLDEFEKASQCYDKSLIINPQNKIVRENKAEMLYLWARKTFYFTKDNNKALKLIDEAISILPDNADGSKYWKFKQETLSRLNKPVEAYKCGLKANNQYDKLNEVEKQLKILNNTDEVLINVTATSFYHVFKPFNPRQILNLIFEPENSYDSDAIRVECDDFGVVGYVANSPDTLIGNLQGASEIKSKIENPQKAEVLFIFLEKYVIAKIIPNGEFEVMRESKLNDKKSKEFLSEMDDIIDSLKDY